MSSMLQSVYMIILNPIYRLTGKINEKARDVIIFIIFLLIFLYFAFYRSPVLNPPIYAVLPTQYEKQMFGCVMLILLTIISVNRPLKRVEWRKSVFVPLFLLGLGMIITGFIHPIGAGYQAFGFMLVLLFPCLYFVWNNRQDYDRLFTILIYAMIVANAVLFLLTVHYAFQGHLSLEGSQRYAGIMSNSNCFSLIGLELVLGVMYLLITHKYSLILSILLYSAAGVGLGIILLGQMRIAFMILLLCILSSMFFWVRNRGDSSRKNALIHLLVGAFFIVQMVLFSFFLVQIDSAVFSSNHESTQGTTQQVSTPQQSLGIIERFDTKGKDANSFSSGRIAIWGRYSKELNLLGNSFDEKKVMEMTGVPYPFAHNVFFEVGYRCGVPVGALSVIIIIISGLLAMRYLLCGHNAKLYLLFPIISAITYALEALLDCAFLPFFQAEAFCYYIAMMVFIDSRS